MEDPSPLPEYYDEYWSAGGTYAGGGLSPLTWRAIQANVGPGTRCLDFGCGDGAVGARVASLVGSYLGMDVSPVAARRAQQLGLDVRVIDPDSSLPADSESFDLVLCLEVFEHLSTPGELAAEFVRCLRPDGMLVATTPNVGYWRQRLDLAILGRWNPRGDLLSATQPWRDPHIRFFTTKSLRDMLCDAGFRDARVRGHDGALLADLPWLRKLTPERGSKPYRRLEAFSPSFFGGRLLATAAK